MGRRGMKELDLLLQAFMDGQENELGQGRWPEFERLLRYEDDILWACLQRPERARDDGLEPLLRAIGAARPAVH